MPTLLINVHLRRNLSLSQSKIKINTVLSRHTRITISMNQKRRRRLRCHLQLVRESLHHLVVNDLDSSISVIKEVIEVEWEASRSPLLESIGLELSTAESGKLESVFAGFLDHSSITMKLYGLRGLEKNGVGSQRERVERLTEEGNHIQIRKTALNIMEGSR